MRLSRRAFIGSGAVAFGTAVLPAPMISALATTPPPPSRDIRILREALTLHPGAYRYQTPRSLAILLDELEAAWQRTPDRLGRFLELASFLGTLRCGHSYPNFYNQSAAVKAELFEDIPRVPFAFRWISDQMVVTASPDGSSILPPGTIITQLNGRRPRDILRSLLPLTRADGGNDGKRRALLEMRGDDGLETFDIWHGLTFGGSASDAIRIDARLPRGQRVRRELPSVTLASRIASAQGAPSGDGPVWQFGVRHDGIAILTMNSWGLYNSRWDWRSWLDEQFASLHAGAGLIIDIRNNEGGLDCGNHILARLAERDIVSATYERRVRFRRTPEALNPFLDTWDNSFRTLGENAQDIGDGFYRLPAEEGAGRIAARGPRLNARVAVLTSAVNSSATFGFAQKCKESGLARLFGGTTGGNRRGINGGSFFFVRLPDSGLEFDLPLVGTFPATPQPDAGIAPDVAVTPTANDIAAGRDPVFMAAEHWLKRG